MFDHEPPCFSRSMPRAREPMRRSLLASKSNLQSFQTPPFSQDIYLADNDRRLYVSKKVPTSSSSESPLSIPYISSPLDSRSVPEFEYSPATSSDLLPATRKLTDTCNGLPLDRGRKIFEAVRFPSHSFPLCEDASNNLLEDTDCLLVPRLAREFSFLDACPVEEEALQPVSKPLDFQPSYRFFNELKRDQKTPEDVITDTVAGIVTPFSRKEDSESLCNDIQREMEELRGADTVFTLAMDIVLTKLFVALDDPECAYLFRDFSGHFTTLLDRFGPGGNDSHRAPAGISWAVRLMVPWIRIDIGSSVVRMSNYEEVNGWIRNLVWLLGAKCETSVLQDGVWDCCIQQLANENSEVSDIAFKTANTIICVLPLDELLVSKLVEVRTATFGYDNSNLCTFRYYHVNLLGSMIERIDSTKDGDHAYEYLVYMTDIAYELKRSLEIEADVRVRCNVEQCARYATFVYMSVRQLLVGSLPAPDSTLTAENTYTAAASSRDPKTPSLADTFQDRDGIRAKPKRNWIYRKLARVFNSFVRTRQIKDDKGGCFDEFDGYRNCQISSTYQKPRSSYKSGSLLDSCMYDARTV